MHRQSKWAPLIVLIAERWIDRVADVVRVAPLEEHLIKEEAGFRHGKVMYTSTVESNSTIEDGYQEDPAFVDMSAAYYTVNHRLLIQKL